MLKIYDILNAVDGSDLYLSGNQNSSLGLEVSAITTDTRKIPPESLFIALKGERFDGHDYLESAVSGGAAVLCVDANFAESADIDLNVPVITVPNTLTAYQQIANFYRGKLQDLTVIGVTGSCGKTSLKEILKTLMAGVYGESAVYATEANNNNAIGVPLSLLSLTKEHRIAVIEMGSNHPGEIETVAKIAEPDIAIITNIARAHLEFFRDLNGVAEEKSAILASYGGRIQPVAIIPDKCPGKEILQSKAGDSVYTFGNSDSADLKVEYDGGNEKGSSFKLLFSERLQKDISISELNVKWRLTGRHQALNAAAALLTVILNDRILFKQKYADIAEALKQCMLTGSRMKFTEIAGIKWINDAYNANPDSMQSALVWLAEFANAETSHIVLGDMLELGADSLLLHRQILNSAIQLLPKTNLYAVGPIMSEAANLAGIDFFPDSEAVGIKLAETVKIGDLVYLKASRGMELDCLVPKEENQ